MNAASAPSPMAMHTGSDPGEVHAVIVLTYEKAVMNQAAVRLDVAHRTLTFRARRPHDARSLGFVAPGRKTSLRGLCFLLVEIPGLQSDRQAWDSF